MSVPEFIKHHFRHFNAAVVVDAAEAYRDHLAGGGKMFLATRLQQGPAQPEEDERITARKFSLRELEKMIRRGALHDGKSVAAILFYARFLK